MHCGMHSHSSQSRGGLIEYLRPITSSECKTLHSTRVLRIGESLITDLPVNSSTTRVVVLAGKVSFDGACQGGSYSDAFGSWDDVVVQGYVAVTLTDYTADADTSQDQIKLRSGVVCKTSSEGCMDIENGYSTWVHERFTSCDSRKHIVLYQGPAQKFTEVVDGSIKTYTYLVENEHKVFGLRTLKTYMGCMFTAYTTEHPKLIIVPKTTGSFYLSQGEVHVASLDIMAYINTKFVYIERLRHTSERSMYAILSAQRCALERKALQTMLAISTISPAEFAYTYMASPGFTAVQLGEVVHVIKCVPVETTVRHTNKCYKEMAVTYNNKSVFLTPRSRLVQQYGTEVDCDNIVTSQFRLDGQWYALGKMTHQVPDPLALTPEPISEWSVSTWDSLTIFTLDTVLEPYF